MRSQSTRVKPPALVPIVVTSALLPVGAALLPLAATSLAGREPYPVTMFWASPGSLLFLAFAGALFGLVVFWNRRTNVSHAPSVTLRIACAVAGVALVPIPPLLFPHTAEAYASPFLAPNLAMAGVAFAWRLRQWSARLRYGATTAIAIIDLEFLIGMLRNAPPELAPLRRLVIPAALILIGAWTWKRIRSEDR